ncbi:MAG: aldehyde dehydrogenase [Cycloclasticus sp.]|nr:aldehyde dehydrogenase [Cycloclasticus sp.]
MSIRIAINGFGRIGRNVLRALYESHRNEKIQLVAINDLEPIEVSAERLKNDSAHELFACEIAANGDVLMVDGDEIQYSSQANPVKLPWKALKIDVVLECTGQFTQAEQSYMHCLAGAKKVLISSLSDDKVDATIVYGVNEGDLQADYKIVSNASCTMNCLAHMLNVFDQSVGVESALSTTLHAYNKEQTLALSKANSSIGSPLIPTKTNSPSSIGLILPLLDGKVDGLSIRIPTMNVALVDLTFTSKKETTVAEVNALIKAAAEACVKDILKYSEKSLVSADFMGNSASCIFDASLTKAEQGRLIKVVAWFDNEWAFSNRMLDTAEAMMSS